MKGWLKENGKIILNIIWNSFKTELPNTKQGSLFMPLSLKHPLAFSLVFVFQQLGFPTFNFFSSIFLLLPLSSFFFLPSFFLLPPTPSISSHNPILSLTHIDMSRNSSPRPSDFLSFSASLSLLFVSGTSFRSLFLSSIPQFI